MGIIYTRVDGRLVHGQVAATWARQLSADEILVLNDEAAANEDEICLMQLAAPVDCEIDVFTIEQGVEIIREEDFNGDRTFIIFKTVQDAVRAAKIGYLPEKLYIGGMYSAPGKVQKSIALYVDDEDIDAFRELDSFGIKLYYQVSPLNKEEDISHLYTEAKY